jgi:GT2 family glycosyltransferase
LGTITAYVPCYNAAETIVRCIEGLLAQTYAANEILIVDDGSSDGSEDLARRYREVRVLRHEKNRGLGAARNTAFQAARNEWVAAVDADCVVQPRWLESLVSALADARVGAVGGKLVETILDSAADRWRAAHLSQDRGDARFVNQGALFGNNLLLRRAVWAQAGGYDERFRSNGEDVDISKRIRACGFDLVYEPSAVVHHLRRDTVTSAQAMFWRYREGFDRTLKLDDVWRNWRYEHFGRARTAWRGDWSAKRFDLLPMDALAFFYPVWLDFQHMKRGRRSRPATDLPLGAES